MGNAEPEGPSLAKLGLKDPLVALAKPAQCREAVGADANAYLAPADVYLSDKSQNDLLRKLLKKLPAMQAVLAPAPKPKKELDKEKAELENNIAALEKQVASLGKLAPAQLLLDKGTSLARIGKTGDARAVFYPLFEKRMFSAAEHGLLGTCLLEPAHWPKSLRWDPWSEEELPKITALLAGAALDSPTGFDGIKAAIGAVKAKNKEAAEKLTAEIRKVSTGLYFSDQDHLLNWTLLSILARATPTDPGVWEWRGVVAARLGEKGASRADLIRGCFLGGETACVLAWWAKNGKTIALAGDAKHYWPL